MSHPFEEKIQRFLEDEAMCRAVREILEAQFDINKLLIGVQSNATNAQLGEMARSCIGGMEFLKRGFKELEKYRKDVPRESDTSNPAV